MNDTEIYIFSTSQLADIGDLSGLKVGYAEFVYATRLQQMILGSSSPYYKNGNLTTLYLGNNKLLKKLDVRNCTGLVQGSRKPLIFPAVPELRKRTSTELRLQESRSPTAVCCGFCIYRIQLLLGSSETNRPSPISPVRLYLASLRYGLKTRALLSTEYPS